MIQDYILEGLEQEVLQQVHDVHYEIEKCKLNVSWLALHPGISREIESLFKDLYLANNIKRQMANRKESFGHLQIDQYRNKYFKGNLADWVPCTNVNDFGIYFTSEKF